MELIIAGFIGIWLSVFTFWGYVRLKNDYKNVGANEEAKES